VKINKYMPEVNTEVNLRAVLTRARQLASVEHRRDRDGQLCRRVAIVLPSRRIGVQECPPASTASAAMVQSVEKILPSNELCNVVAIAFNDLKAPGRIEDVANVIPFLGFLMGFAYVGHNVIVFEGHPSSFAAGLFEADLLLVDAQMIPFLQKDWLDTAFATMRKPEIRIYQPNGQVQAIGKKTD
jgi:hypothetical protein